MRLFLQSTVWVSIIANTSKTALTWWWSETGSSLIMNSQLMSSGLTCSTPKTLSTSFSTKIPGHFIKLKNWMPRSPYPSADSLWLTTLISKRPKITSSTNKVWQSKMQPKLLAITQISSSETQLLRSHSLPNVGLVIQFGLIIWTKMLKNFGSLFTCERISKVQIIYTGRGTIWMNRQCSKELKKLNKWVCPWETHISLRTQQ